MLHAAAHHFKFFLILNAKSEFLSLHFFSTQFSPMSLISYDRTVREENDGCGYNFVSLQAISKIHLTLNYSVASLFKRLTYSHVCCAFSSVRAFLSRRFRRESLNVSWIFEMASNIRFTSSELAVVLNSDAIGLL